MSGWDTRYQTGDTPWDLGGPSKVVMAAVRSSLKTDARILVPGCGLGWDVEALARLGHDVTGTDLSPSAVERARRRVGALPATRLIVGDALSPPPDWRAQFDAMVEHTFFCAINPRRRPDYIAAAEHCLRPGGLLLGAFLHFAGGGPPYGTSPSELERLFSPRFDILEMSEAGVFSPKGCPQLRVIMRRQP